MVHDEVQYFSVYKLTFQDLKSSPKNRPQLKVCMGQNLRSKHQLNNWHIIIVFRVAQK